ncbi:MAG: Holliday junction branch migration protein RuvA, partial [Gammaproteobacteria bacterium]|nr:Holliday junction branch migration protein RuvA [Gammaproteobacteria bacterium]
MIGRIKGILAARDDAIVVVDVAGVGYEIELTNAARAMLPAVGETVSIYTHLVIREDAHALFGFESLAERDLFRSLIKVSGIGPKLALTLLSGINVADFVRCIRDGDVTRLTKLPGVGKKTAERLVVELKDRIDRMVSVPAAAPRRASESGAKVIEEAERALISLGYKQVDAHK